MVMTPTQRNPEAAATASAGPSRTTPRHPPRDIGLDVRLPKSDCEDPKCPFHGRLKVRGQILEGTVVSSAMQGTVVVSRTLLHYVPKYERYEKRRRRYLAHAPPCLGITTGRRVKIAETRPLAKNVSFVVVEDLGEASREVRGEDPARRQEPSSPEEGA
jgi:small subunit ribosomal protein S17